MVMGMGTGHTVHNHISYINFHLAKVAIVGATQSTTWRKEIAERAIDGDLITRSLTNNEQPLLSWLRIDLGQTYDIAHLLLCYPKNRGPTYKKEKLSLELSADGSTWVPCKQPPVIENSVSISHKFANATITCDESHTTGRYVKLSVVKMLEVRELEVYVYV